MKSKICIESLFLLSLFTFASCDRFPRDNPIDPVNSTVTEAEIILDEEPQIDDALEYDVRNNGNGEIEPGETIRFVAELANEGQETAVGVTATISSTNPCVLSSTVRSASGRIARYGDIEPGHTGPSPELIGSFYYEVVFSSSECSAGDAIVFSLEVEDEDDRTWDIPIEFDIVESDANIEIVQERITTRDDITEDIEVPSCNNGNQEIERGETVHLDIPIQNTGNSVARGLRAKLVSRSPGCVVFPEGEGETSETLSYGDIKPGLWSNALGIQRADSPAYFVVETNVDGCPRQGNLDFRMVVEDVSNRTWELSVTRPLNLRDVNVVYYDDFIDDSPAIRPENDDYGDADPGERFYLDIQLENQGHDLVPSITLGEGDQERPTCVDDLLFRNATMSRLTYGNISPDQRLTPVAGILEVVLSEENCESGDEFELVFEARDGCKTELAEVEHTWEIRVPITID